MSSNLTNLAKHSTARRPEEEPAEAEKPEAAQPPQTRRTANPTKKSPKKQVLTKTPVNIRLTAEARHTINEAAAAHTVISSLGIAVVEALRATEPRLREEIKNEEQADPWADETKAQRQLASADDSELLPTTLRLSPSQANRLKQLAEELGWSPSLVCDQAIRRHFMNE